MAQRIRLKMLYYSVGVNRWAFSMRFAATFEWPFSLRVRCVQGRSYFSIMGTLSAGGVHELYCVPFLCPAVSFLCPQYEHRCSQKKAGESTLCPPSCSSQSCGPISSASLRHSATLVHLRSAHKTSRFSVFVFFSFPHVLDICTCHIQILYF